MSKRPTAVRQVVIVPDDVDTPTFHTILETVRSRLESKLDNEGALFKTLSMTMIEIQKTGIKTNKKVLAENVLTQLLMDSDIPSEKKDSLLKLIDDDVLGNTIDLVVSAARGDLELKKVARKWFRITGISLLNTCCAKPATLEDEPLPELPSTEEEATITAEPPIIQEDTEV